MSTGRRCRGRTGHRCACRRNLSAGIYPPGRPDPWLRSRATVASSVIQPWHFWKSLELLALAHSAWPNFVRLSAVQERAANDKLGGFTGPRPGFIRHPWRSRSFTRGAEWYGLTSAIPFTGTHPRQIPTRGAGSAFTADTINVTTYAIHPADGSFLSISFSTLLAFNSMASLLARRGSVAPMDSILESIVRARRLEE
jgi:hypothetical protein